jgi:hypothetical protein
MSSDPREDENETPEPLPFDRNEGSTELSMRETFQVLFLDTSVRNFVFVALGALGMIFLILLQQASDIGGLLVVFVGLCGILLRWRASPAFVLILLTYFMVFPFGIPAGAFENGWEIEEGRFRVTDIMLVLSVLVYLACQYRIYGFVSQAVAFEGAIRRKGETPARRPPALIRPAELGILLGACAVFVVLGQLIWWLANAVEVVPIEDFPFQWARPGHTILNRGTSATSTTGGMNTGTTRFVVIVGLLLFGSLLARLTFGYWRLRMMKPAEGGMALLDGGWSETSRERQRQEKWRIWGQKRSDERAKAAEAHTIGGKS